jgi:hypothetical protein
MPTAVKDLWSLVLDHQYVDPQELAAAIEEEATGGNLDYRTRLLIRDGVDALESHWGRERLATWLAQSPSRFRIDTIRSEPFGAPGFPFLVEQIMEPTRPETIKQFLRELGQSLHARLKIYIGGSGALILAGYLARRTQDLDVVDEVPAEIRSQAAHLKELTQRYRLQLAHFQSHYLPQGWEQRVHSLGSFGQLEVSLVDVYDVFLSKLFSARARDRDDLRALLPQLSKDTLLRRLKETTDGLQRDATLRQQAAQNWYILFGETLPSES